MPSGQDESVTCWLPAGPAASALARAVGDSFGALAGLDVDRLDDLRLALSETVALICATGAKELAVTLVRGAESVHVHAVGTGPLRPIDEDSTAWLLLAALTDESTVLPGSDAVVRFVIPRRSP